MQARKVQKPGFKPFIVEITVETPEEAQALYAIFCHSRNAALLSNHDCLQIRKEIGTEYAVGHSSVISNGVTSEIFYNKF